ncbi:hypothetical protein V5O48_013186 [Marasmius crinis-equi]|uniref:Carboxylic ester hydrolase n=1 Tax=Marasmius crinis-equi TaxID=585013 RepID=A0ABR3F0S2_9AGAR
MLTASLHPLYLYLVGLFTPEILGNLTSPQIQLGHGGPTVIGKQVSENVEFFGGIPYAEAPVGDLRLREAIMKDYAATTVIESMNIINATDFGKACLQPGIPRDTVSEDCLTVNVYRPSNILVDSNYTPLPVLLWMHGGGFVSGSGSRPGYNGTALVERGIIRGSPIIVITINYRLGPLGFPQGREVDEKKDLLNLGLKDQLIALEWVQQHIEAFGGDPLKVTVFGESAGGRSIELLILSGKLQGLVRGAIMQSSGRIPTHTPSVRHSSWVKYIESIPTCAREASSTSVDCIRSYATSDELYDALEKAGITASSFDWAPVIDGPGGTVPGYPSQVEIPDKTHISMVYGNVLDEGTMATPQNVNSSAEIVPGLFPMFTPSPRGDDILERSLSELLALYPDDPSAGAPFNTGDKTFGLNQEFKRYAAMFTDLIESAERRLFAQKVATSQVASKTPIYMYLFADANALSVTPSEFKPPEGSYAPGSLGVPHTSEILYVFGNFDVENSTMPQSSRDLSKTMMDYWISFAASLDPNDAKGSTRPQWPPYHSPESNSDPMLLQFKGGDTKPIPDTFREPAIAYINKNSVVFDA